MNEISENELSKRIVFKLKEKGISQRELANKVGVSEATIAFYANGKRIPNLNTAYKIANALNCSIDELSGINTSYNKFESNDEAAVRAMYSMLNKNGKRQVFEYLENLTCNSKNLDKMTKTQLDKIHGILSNLQASQTL